MNPEQRKRLLDLIRRYGKQPTTWVGVTQMLQTFHALNLRPEIQANLPVIMAGVIGAALFVYDEDKS